MVQKRANAIVNNIDEKKIKPGKPFNASCTPLEGGETFEINQTVARKRNCSSNPILHDMNGVTLRQHKNGLLRIKIDTDLTTDEVTDKAIDDKCSSFRTAMRKVKQMYETLKSNSTGKKE